MLINLLLGNCCLVLCSGKIMELNLQIKIHFVEKLLGNEKRTTGYPLLIKSGVDECPYQKIQVGNEENKIASFMEIVRFVHLCKYELFREYCCQISPELYLINKDNTSTTYFNFFSWTYVQCLAERHEISTSFLSSAKSRNRSTVNREF